MANLVAPFGARPVRHRNGAPYNGACRLYFSAGASALYIGDPVIVTSAGANSAPYFGSPPGSLPTVALATAGRSNAITGFIVGFYPETAQSTVYGANGANRGVYVCDDPDVIFEIMDSGAATPTVAFASSTGNLDLSTFSGSTATARSGATLNTTLDNNAAAQLKIIALAERPNNVVGKNAVWEVTINNHTLVAGVAGI
jgi:hypothetical protein